MKLTTAQEQLAKEFLDSGKEVCKSTDHIGRSINNWIYQTSKKFPIPVTFKEIITIDQLNWYRDNQWERDMGDDESIELNQQAIDAQGS